MLFRLGLSALFITLLSACVSVDRELKNYSAEWPRLVDTNCAPPLGTFANLPDEAHYEYEDRRTSMSLEQAFNSFHQSSHVNIEAIEDGQYKISFLSIVDTEVSLLGDILLTKDDYTCKENRFTLISDTTHETFSGYQDPEYNPLYTAAYVIGTFGIAGPLSEWWEYRLTLAEDGSLIIRRLEMDSGLLFLMYARTAMNDDWFRFESAPITLLPKLN